MGQSIKINAYLCQPLKNSRAEYQRVIVNDLWYYCNFFQNMAPCKSELLSLEKVMSITKKRIAFLPSQFKPESVDSLVRLGRDYDGGYLVDERCLVNADLLLGLGINDDWSFEEDFSTRSNIPVLAFDGSIGAHVFRKKALRRFINVRKFLSFVHWFKKYIAYKKFFSKKNKHYPLFLGIDNNKNYISLDTLFKSYVDAGKNKGLT